LSVSDSVSFSDSDDSSLLGILSSIYNLVDLSDEVLSEEDLDFDNASQYIKDLVVQCPN
jgi:hypothetical protein